MTPVEIYQLLKQAGFTPDEATTMVAVAMAESGGRPAVVNSTGEYSTGLFQINTDSRSNPDLAYMDLTDPLQNAQAAKIVYDRQGLQAWTVTHTDKGAKYLSHVTAAVNAARMVEATGIGDDAYLFNPMANWEGTPGYGGAPVSAVGTGITAGVSLEDFQASVAVRQSGIFGGDPTSIDEAGIEVQDAWQVAKRMLDDYGLSSLFPQIESFLLKGLSAEAAVGRIRDTQEFKDRFPGLQNRVDNGYNAISPATYLTYEDNIRNLMVEAGFSPGFYDEPEDLAQFISNDVRPDEINDRIKLAQRAVMDADPLVKAELQERFGIGLDTEADLVAYFLDPDRAVPLLEMQSQVGVAELSAATQRAMGTGRTLQTETAQELVRRGYSKRELGERLKGRGGMTQGMVGGGLGVSASEVAAAEFGLDSEAVANVRRLRQDRQKRGTRMSGAMISQTGVSGFSSTNT